MNTKMKSFLLSTFAVILATSASAQVTSILPGGRGNLYIGTPMNLPGPAANIVISPRINLPAPLLTPVSPMLLAPVPASMMEAALVRPVALPVVVVALDHAAAQRVSAANSNRALRANLSAPSAPSAPSAAAKDITPKELPADREKLENLFDGRRQPAEKSPVRSDRRQSLPEQDLESEIGAY